LEDKKKLTVENKMLTERVNFLEMMENMHQDEKAQNLSY
jgi:hypothetical protein